MSFEKLLTFAFVAKVAVAVIVAGFYFLAKYFEEVESRRIEETQTLTFKRHEPKRVKTLNLEPMPSPERRAA